MVSFDNPSGTAEDGNKCDVGIFSDGPECDHVFRFALDLGNRCGPTSSQYYVGYLGIKFRML